MTAAWPAQISLGTFAESIGKDIFLPNRGAKLTEYKLGSVNGHLCHLMGGTDPE